jgi:L-aminopeptidase/D-esterase-like protein
VRGGSPGTRETDLLRPENTVGQVHALLLTGGSAFGLAAADGVMRWLEAHGHGLPVGPQDGAWPVRVPIVPAAVLFDLWIGDARIRPDADAGFAACAAASTAPPAEGSVATGARTTVGKLFGIGRAMRGGIGSASLRVDGVTVAALVAVNALGDVLDADGRVIAGARTADGLALLDSTAALRRGERSQRPVRGSATTIGVVATDATLGKAQATQLAALAHHGLSRSIRPLTPHDGDTLFALATARVPGPADLTLLGALAAEVVSMSIRRAVLAASALAQPALPSVSDM